MEEAKKPEDQNSEIKEKKPEKKKAESKKSKGKKNPNKKRVILIIIAAVVVVLAALGFIFRNQIGLLFEKAPTNEDALNSSPDVLSLDEKALADVTAITGTDKDKTGIVDEEGHKIYDTGYKNDKGETIYTTGKKDASGNVLYTLNKTDTVGKLIYYTGKVTDGKMELKVTTTIPDYKSNNNSSLTNGNRYSTTKTIGYKADKNEVTADSISNKYITYVGGSNEDILKKIVPVKNGYIAVGNSNSRDGIYSNADSSWKEFFGSVSKISEDGKFEWTYVAGGDNLVMFNDAAELKDGSIVAVGITCAADGTVSKTSIASSSFIVKLDSKGKEVWKYVFPCSEEENGDEADCVAATPDGGFIVGGEAESTTGFFKDVKGQYKAYLFKFDKKGTIEWRKILSGSKDNTFTAVAVNDSGDVFATCVTHSYDGNFAFLAEYKTNNNNPNTVVVKLGSDGSVAWSTSLAGWGQSEFNTIAVTPDGGCVIGGTMSIVKRANGSYTHCNGSTDGYVVRYNKDGNVYWAHNIGGTEADSIRGIAYTDKGIVVVGETQSTNYDFAGLISAGGREGFITVLNNSGNIVVKNLVGGSGNEILYSACESDNGFVVVGSTTSSDGVFKASNANKKAEAFVAKYNFASE